MGAGVQPAAHKEGIHPCGEESFRRISLHLIQRDQENLEGAQEFVTKPHWQRSEILHYKERSQEDSGRDQHRRNQVRCIQTVWLQGG